MRTQTSEAYEHSYFSCTKAERIGRASNLKLKANWDYFFTLVQKRLRKSYQIRTKKWYFYHMQLDIKGAIKIAD